MSVIYTLASKLILASRESCYNTYTQLRGLSPIIRTSTEQPRWVIGGDGYSRADRNAPVESGSSVVRR
jgi:hypothetical protein